MTEPTLASICFASDERHITRTPRTIASESGGAGNYEVSHGISLREGDTYKSGLCVDRWAHGTYTRCEKCADRRAVTLYTSFGGSHKKEEKWGTRHGSRRLPEAVHRHKEARLCKRSLMVTRFFRGGAESMTVHVRRTRGVPYEDPSATLTISVTV